MKRLYGIDIARGIAVITMMVVHVIPLQTDEGMSTIAGTLFSGKASSLFAVLAGISIVLFSRKAFEGIASNESSSSHDLSNSRSQANTAALKKTRKQLLIRAISIVIIGLVISTLPHGVAVILVHYGFLFLIGMLLVNVSMKALVFTTSAWAIVAPIVYYIIQNSLYRIENNEIIDSPERLWHSPSVYDITDPVMLLDLFVTGYYPLIIWPVYVLAGLIIGRLLVSGYHNLRSMLTIGVMMTVIPMIVHYIMIHYTNIVDKMAGLTNRSEEYIIGAFNVGNNNISSVHFIEWFALNTAHTGSYSEIVHNIGVALTVIVLSTMIFNKVESWKGIVNNVLMKPVFTALAGIGSMPLTLYVGHLIVLALWRTDIFVMPGIWLVVAFIAVFMVSGYVKMRLKKKGPIESFIAYVSN